MKQTIQQNPICPHFGACAGCCENPSFKPPPAWQEVLSFLERMNTPALHQGLPYHWRHRAKVAVRGVCGNPLIGLFKRSSHDVLPIPSCLVHHPRLNQAFELVREWMVRNALIPYQEETGLGDLRYVQGVVQRESGQVQLTLVMNGSDHQGEKSLHWQKLVRQLGENHPMLWHSLWLNFNDLQTNTIFGPAWSLVTGQEDLWEKFGKTEVCYGPASFGQANLPLFERMLDKIVELLPENACIAEFYAGVGAIGLALAPHCQWLRCSEINPFAEDYFNRSLERLSPSIASRLSFTTAPTHQALSILNEATTVVADPPRKGLDQTLLSAIKKAPTVKQLLYISCGWESFKKDTQQLLTDGWKIESVDGYLFFPGSNHVELLANFTR